METGGSEGEGIKERREGGKEGDSFPPQYSIAQHHGKASVYKCVGVTRSVIWRRRQHCFNLSI